MLLTLVERRRLPIAELSLAQVADQYLSHVRSIGVSTEALADFLVIGARLVLIKSRALLPREESADEAEEESADDLVRRLEVYRAFRTLAAVLAERDAAGHAAFPRGALDSSTLTLDAPVLAPIGADLLARLVLEIETRIIAPPVANAPTAPRVSIDDRLALLRRKLAARGEVDWSAVAGRSIPEVVATFLAVLEMVRRGEVDLIQPELFGPIRLVRSKDASEASSGVASIG